MNQLRKSYICFLFLKGMKHLFLLATSVASAPDLEFERVCELFTSKLAFHPFHPFTRLYFIQLRASTWSQRDSTKQVKVKRQRRFHAVVFDAV